MWGGLGRKRRVLEGLEGISRWMQGRVVQEFEVRERLVDWSVRKEAPLGLGWVWELERRRRWGVGGCRLEEVEEQGTSLCTRELVRGPQKIVCIFKKEPLLSGSGHSRTEGSATSRTIQWHCCTGCGGVTRGVGGGGTETTLGGFFFCGCVRVGGGRGSRKGGGTSRQKTSIPSSRPTAKLPPPPSPLTPITPITPPLYLPPPKTKGDTTPRT